MNIDIIPPNLPTSVPSVNAEIENKFLIPKQIITRRISSEESKYYNLENSLTMNASSLLLLELEKSQIKTNKSIVSVHSNNFDKYKVNFNLLADERIEYKVSDFTPNYNFIDDEEFEFELTEKVYKLDFNI